MLTKCSQLVKYEFYTSGKTIYHAGKHKFLKY